MRLSSVGSDWKSASGWLAVAAVLLLSAPGVRIARAEEEQDLVQVGTTVYGPSCGITSVRDVENWLQLETAKMRQLLQAEHQRSVDPELAGNRPITLNNRGYSY